jgi:transposase InsO family protein
MEASDRPAFGWRGGQVRARESVRGSDFPLVLLALLVASRSVGMRHLIWSWHAMALAWHGGVAAAGARHSMHARGHPPPLQVCFAARKWSCLVGWA